MKIWKKIKRGLKAYGKTCFHNDKWDDFCKNIKEKTQYLVLHNSNKFIITTCIAKYGNAIKMILAYLNFFNYDFQEPFDCCKTMMLFVWFVVNCCQNSAICCCCCNFLQHPRAFDFCKMMSLFLVICCKLMLLFFLICCNKTQKNCCCCCRHFLKHPEPKS